MGTRLPLRHRSPRPRPNPFRGSRVSEAGDRPLAPTPSQTIGPFFHFALAWSDGGLVVSEGTPGAIRISGAVRDGAGEPVPDALVETWQADPDGRFAHPDDPRGAVAWSGFRGLARVTTDGRGEFELLTLKPGALPGPGETVQAPHLVASIFARGLLQRLVTRIYFADEESANAGDPVLGSLATAQRQGLLAEPVDGGYRFEVHLQGATQTTFFAI
ncbi:MAG: protocatechuate 3,4-dioxygenase subunit alpha [Actinobacteria bacterium]|nr:protocatechuate 3,4-dioxygenase subunit alpha [Actinomycetota bacterium]